MDVFSLLNPQLQEVLVLDWLDLNVDLNVDWSEGVWPEII